MSAPLGKAAAPIDQRLRADYVEWIRRRTEVRLDVETVDRIKQECMVGEHEAARRKAMKLEEENQKLKNRLKKCQDELEVEKENVRVLNNHIESTPTARLQAVDTITKDAKSGSGDRDDLEVVLDAIKQITDAMKEFGDDPDRASVSRTFRGIAPRLAWVVSACFHRLLDRRRSSGPVSNTDRRQFAEAFKERLREALYPDGDGKIEIDIEPFEFDERFHELARESSLGIELQAATFRILDGSNGVACKTLVVPRPTEERTT